MFDIEKDKLEKLESLKGELRIKILETYFKVKAGHIGSSLSCIDLMISTLLCTKKKDDTFILSKGHAAVSLYVCLNYLGEISDDELFMFYKDGTKLPAHPAPDKFHNIPFATGSLGHGLPIAAGIAKANKLNKTNNFVYVLMSDGETNEGTTWEASNFAVSNKLDNLIVIIDKNKLQGFGYTNEVMGDTSAFDIYKAIGYDIVEVDGHDIPVIIDSVERLKNSANEKPKLIIANTVKGKGVSYMEHKMEWHYITMNENLFETAINDIHKSYNMQKTN